MKLLHTADLHIGKKIFELSMIEDQKYILNQIFEIAVREEIDALLTEQAAQPNAWIPDENQRKQRYKELISSGDSAALISMIHALHKQRQSLKLAGRKFHISDENFLRDAEKLLSAEFSLVLNIHPSEVGTYIQRVFNTD